MKQNDAVLNLRIATELHDQLKALAQTKYMPLSVMVRLALMDYIKQEAPLALSHQSAPLPQQRRPLSPREIRELNDQRLRQPAGVMPQSPSTQTNLSGIEDWL